MRLSAAAALTVAVLVSSPALAAPPTKAQSDAMFEKAMDIIRSDPVQSRRLIEQVAESKDPEAINALSLYWREGIGGPKDKAKGFAMLQEAEAAGSYGAKLTLGGMLLDSASPDDQKRAVRMLEEAGRINPRARPIAAAGLGKAYLLSRGVEQDMAKGVGLLEESEAGNVQDAHVAYLLGRTYQNGWGGRTIDKAKAAGYYRAACDRDWPRACWHLGMALLNGEGVAKDDKAAYRAVRKSGDLGDVRGQISTGVMLATGEGVVEDDAESRVWYRRAAEQSSSHALRELGMMLITGEGGPVDQARGLAYVELARDAGDTEAAAMIKRLDAKPDAAFRAEVDRFKTEWIAKRGKPATVD